MLRPNGDATQSWLLGSVRDRLQKLAGRSALQWAANGIRGMSGDVILINKDSAIPGPLTTITIPDAAPSLTGFPIKWEWNVRNQTVTVVLQEIPPALSGETYKGSYETPDGVLVPIAEPVDLTAPVPVPTNPSPRQNTSSSNTLESLIAMAATMSQFTLTLTARPKPDEP